MLAFEYSRVMYVTILLFANDATACFDRMVPAISTIIAMKYGMAPEVMISRNMVMEDMEHIIRTSHGDSTITYRQNSDDVRINGETQGKGDVGSLWSIMSQSILQAHQQLHDGICLPHINDDRMIKKNNDAYVDNDDGLTSHWDFDLPSSIAKTIADAQMGAQIWTDLLEGTGQSIAFHKSMWQLLGFDPATFPPRIVDQAPHSITLKDRMGAPSTISQFRSDQPHWDASLLQMANRNRSSISNYSRSNS